MEDNLNNPIPKYDQPVNPVNFNQPGKIIIPNAVASMVLGIISIFFSLIWCYWFGTIISLVCGIIGLVLSKKGVVAVNNSPSSYLQSSISINNAGRVMSIIGVCLASLEFLVLIAIILFFGAYIGNLTHLGNNW